MSFLKNKIISIAKESTKKVVVKSFESNKESVATVAGATVLGVIGLKLFKLLNYISTERNEDKSAELQRKTEENNHKIWFWSFARV
jgi:hypothetical protein